MRLIVLSACLGLALVVVAQDQRPFSTLEERMTGEEFTRTGLHKLSEAELAALNRWIRERSLATLEGAEGGRSERGRDVAVEDRRGLREASDDRPISSRIVGAFDGFHERRDYELENGMVWRQTETKPFSVGEIDNARIEIKSGVFGSWYLTVEGYNTRVRVERIR